ncbi:RHS repeat protein [Spirosoma taeanense]|uniref:RHS repeat protein n=1 Tax=Spirosoma taeanense TaxID=2735870 RepID=A0A6M5YBY9_9BACT|nr:DUF6531 domain-containing protein [Spirosoma taeanense]QJW91637.1 RHS repeat protein [Spirosoma taeanense]
MHRTLDGRAVDVATGEVVLSVTDVTTSGPVPFCWGRIWRSNYLAGGSVGNGWRHSYDYVLLEDQRSRQVVIRTPDNRAVVFPLLMDGESSLNRYEKFRLDRDALGYRLQQADGLRYRFAASSSGSSFRLVAIEQAGVAYCIQLSYNQLGHLIRVSDSGQRIIEVTTNAHGFINQLTLMATDTTQQRLTLVLYRYDDEHNLIEAAVTDRHTIQYHYRQQRIVRLSDVLRREIFFSYAKIDNQFRCTEVRQEVERYVRQFRYFVDEGRTLITDEAGNNRQYIHEAGTVQQFMSAEGRQRIWFHNEYNELLSEQGPQGNTTFFSYDARGNLTQASWPDGGTIVMTYDDSNQLRTLTDRAGGVWQWSYDQAGRLLSCIDPAGAETGFSYNSVGLLIRRQINGQLVEWDYDASSNPIRQITATRQTTWTYDVLGRLTFARLSTQDKPLYPVDPALIEPPKTSLPNPYQPVYDADGLLIRLRRDRLNWLFIRDVSGAIREYGRSDGLSSRFHYDAAGRLTEVLFDDGSWFHYTYRPDGWLIEATSPTTQVRFERDTQGRVLLEIANLYTIQTEYGQTGNRVSQQSSSQSPVLYEYDVRMQLSRITYSAGSFVITYDRQGRPIEQLWPGGLRSRRQYDAGTRPVSQSIYWDSQLQAGRFQTYSWVRSQPVRVQDNRFGTVELRYDKAGEVVEAVCSAGWIERWVADRHAYQQRLLRPALDIAQLGWQQISVGGMRFYYDTEGYLREKQVAGRIWHFHWHQSGLLERVVRPDKQNISFSYDALGRRIEQMTGDRTVRWAWDGRRLAREWHQLGNSDPVQLTWYMAEGLTPVMLEVNEQVYSVVCNDMGQPLSMHKPSGELVWEYGWCLFGKKYGLAGPNHWHSYIGPGQFNVPEAGLVYADFLYYDVDTGLPLSPEYSSPAGWARVVREPPHAPESYLSAARCIRVY